MFIVKVTNNTRELMACHPIYNFSNVDYIGVTVGVRYGKCRKSRWVITKKKTRKIEIRKKKRRETNKIMFESKRGGKT